MSSLLSLYSSLQGIFKEKIILKFMLYYSAIICIMRKKYKSAVAASVQVTVVSPPAMNLHKIPSDGKIIDNFEIADDENMYKKVHS